MSAEVDRYAPAERLIVLGLALSESRGGLTLDEMADRLGVSRRTTERLRNCLDRVCGGLHAHADDEGRKRWTLPAGRFGAFSVPKAEELAELKTAAARLRRTGSEAEAALLDRLALKLEAMLPRSALRRLEPDIDLLLEATGVLVRPGPKAIADPRITTKIREAILGSRRIVLTYRRRDTGELSRPRLCPYGLLSGDRHYLVAFNLHPRVREYRLYVVANIENVNVLDQSFQREASFDLQRFSTRSFGVYWDGEAYEVEWRFKPPAASDARHFCFHPNQRIAEQADGSVLVSFTASGLTEMAWHLFRWGHHVEIIRPEVLKLRYRECLESAGNVVGGDNNWSRKLGSAAGSTALIKSKAGGLRSSARRGR